MNAIRDIRHKAVKAREKVVLFAIATRADADAVAWPSIERIADDAGLCETAARKAVQQLRALGLVHIQHRKGRTHCVTILDARLVSFVGKGCAKHTPERVRGVCLAQGRGVSRTPEHDQEHDLYAAALSQDSRGDGPLMVDFAAALKKVGGVQR